MQIITPTVERSATDAQLLPAHTWRRLGLIALSTDLTTERDYRCMLPAQGLGLYTNRVAFENPTTPENLRQMAPRLTAAAALLPDDYPLDAICYSCTAASIVIGDDVIEAAIQAACPGVPVVTPSLSTVHAFTALGIERISVLTPYLLGTSEPLIPYFTQHGLAIQRMHCLGLDDDREMARISALSIIDAACAVDHPDSQGVFLSCTGLPAVAVIEQLEQRLGKPVVSSNQATAWALLQHAKLGEKLHGYGCLFEHSLPTLNR